MVKMELQNEQIMKKDEPLQDLVITKVVHGQFLPIQIKIFPLDKQD